MLILKRFFPPPGKRGEKAFDIYLINFILNSICFEKALYNLVEEK